MGVRLRLHEATHLELAAALAGQQASAYARDALLERLHAVAPLPALWNRIHARLRVAIAQRPALLRTDDVGKAIEILMRGSTLSIGELAEAFEHVRAVEAAAMQPPRPGERPATPDELAVVRALLDGAAQARLECVTHGAECPELSGTLDDEPPSPSPMRADVDALIAQIEATSAQLGLGAKRPRARRKPAAR